MTLPDIISEIKEKYSDHEELNELIDDLSNKDALSYWARELCSENFKNDRDLARKVYEIIYKESEGSFELTELAADIANIDILADKDWGKRIFEEAVENSADAMDIKFIADSVGLKDGLADKVWASDLYKKSVVMASRVDDYTSIAEALSDDVKLSKDIYKKAIAVSKDSSDYQCIACSIVRDSSLGDKELASSIMKQAIEFDDNDYNSLKNLAYTVLVDFDKEWAKDVYVQAIKACEDDSQRACVIIAIRDDLKDRSLTDELLEEYGLDEDDDEFDCYD